MAPSFASLFCGLFEEQFVSISWMLMWFWQETGILTSLYHKSTDRNTLLHITLFLWNVLFLFPNLVGFAESVSEMRTINSKRSSWQTSSGRERTKRSGSKLPPHILGKFPNKIVWLRDLNVKNSALLVLLDIPLWQKKHWWYYSEILAHCLERSQVAISFW